MTIEYTHDTTSTLYKDALDIRKRVFVQEQHVPETIEVDANETKAVHFVNYIKQRPAGTARLCPCPDKTYDLIQRVAVLPQYRGQHVGVALIQAVAAYHQAHYPQRALQLGAQVQAIPFYQRLGFEVIADWAPYIEAGIHHREMRYVKK